MRKILYSPGYGAGWTSWHSGTKQELKFMLEHPGIINALENPKGNKVYCKNYSSELDTVDEDLDENLANALIDFVEEYKSLFGEKNIPYLGGARDLAVMEVEDDELVQIKHRDGYEHVTVINNYWL